MGDIFATIAWYGAHILLLAILIVLLCVLVSASRRNKEDD